jgi:hypothetical protein
VTIARRTLFVLLVVGLLALAAVPATAKPLKSARFQSFHFLVGCGVQLPELGGMSCFSEAIPSTELDGYVELHKRGEAQTGERGDSPWVNASMARPLKKGQAWRRAGVTCKRKGAVVRCVNQDKHGFELSPDEFRVF